MVEDYQMTLWQNTNHSLAKAISLVLPVDLLRSKVDIELSRPHF